MKAIKIFTVDDYLLTRIAYKKYFSSKEGFRIIGDFSTAYECIEHLEIIQPDIILMDIELPELNGLCATKIIKEKYPKVKVIIVTSFEKEEQILSALANGACGYVLKNSQTDLTKTITTVLHGGFFMDLEIASGAFSKIPSLNSAKNYDLSEKAELIEPLTQRELEVLKLMVEGKTNSQIAQEIVVSTNTAKAHVGKILSKLAVNDRVQAVVKAIRSNLC